MTLDDMFAAEAITMSAAELEFRLVRLEAEFERRRHDDLARARNAAFLDSMDLERAAYELAERFASEGNLRSAVRWYRVAARGDHGDAALRLGETLDLLADRCARDDNYSVRREELYLIREAAQAYAEAYAAGYPEAADKIDHMLESLASRRSAPRAAESPRDPAGTDECTYVRDFVADGAVLHEEEIQQLSRHAAGCLPCLEEFVNRVIDTALTAHRHDHGTATRCFGLRGS
jgi:hypothetical protein